MATAKKTTKKRGVKNGLQKGQGEKAVAPKKTGRPPKYETPEELEAAVEAYFAECASNIIKLQKVSKGEVVIIETPEPPTMAGLAHFLDVDRKTLLKYGNEQGHDPRFIPVITRARRRIERSNISLGLTGALDARLTSLNLASNFGYADKQEVSGGDGSPLIPQPKSLDEVVSRIVEILNLAAKREDKTASV